MLDLKKYSIIEIYSLFFENICQCKMSKDLCLGVFYMTIHIVYIIAIIYNLFFMHNIIYTFILLVIIYMNSLIVFLLRTCPIVLLEKKYINTTCLKTLFFSVKYENKKDKKDKKDKVLSTYLDYGLDEFTLQGLTTVGLIVAIKLLILSVF
jgi:hypothetical protein